MPIQRNRTTLVIIISSGGERYNIGYLFQACSLWKVSSDGYLRIPEGFFWLACTFAHKSSSVSGEVDRVSGQRALCD